MIWSIDKASMWMFNTGMEHIEDGLFSEGGELIYESKFGDGCFTKINFINSMKRICWWDEDSIIDVIKEF